jgi:hypothetical protein
MLLLTQAEAQVARVRVAQARTEAVRRELTQNGDHAERRTQQIADQLDALGGIPDAVSPVLGRLTTLVKGTVEQAGPFDEALLGDLAVEQQLLGRARYLKALAQAAGRTDVQRLAEQLEAAHSATVDWISIVLAEEALGGPAALRATPLQRVAGGATQVVRLPARVAREGVNRTVHGVQDVSERARDAVSDLTRRVGKLGGVAREVAVTGRNASLERAETVARREGARDTAKALHETRRGLGTLTADELPISGYSELNQQDAIARIKELDDSTDVRTIIGYEEAHRNRSSVISAAQTRVAALAKQTIGD